MASHHEFWNPRLFEAPYYCYLALKCALNGIGIRTLAKADYCLDHGEIGIGSKFNTQMAFDQCFFLPTQLIDHSLPAADKQELILNFTATHGFPIILKPDIGCVGKGISRVSGPDTLTEVITKLDGNTILQAYTPFDLEYGVFYVRIDGQPCITGINRKHFPTIEGNGVLSIGELATSHPRYSRHWEIFLQYHDLNRILDDGETLQLSFIGSHTMGCMFTDDTHLLNEALEQRIFSIFADQPGFNFGRLDVKAESEKAFYNGDFVVIEINGVASLPTHMFDPKYSLSESYRIFFQHADYLVRAAKENRDVKMPLLPLIEITRRVKRNQTLLNQVHERFLQR